MSEFTKLAYAVAPEWVGKPLMGRPDGSALPDDIAEFADRANLAVEKLDTPSGIDDLGLNILGASATALSQWHQSTADSKLIRLGEAAAAFGADWAMGNVPILGPVIKKIPIPGAEAIGEFLSANFQPLLDAHGLKRATKGRFSIGEWIGGSLRVAAAAGDDKWSGSTKAVARLKARADMGNASAAVASLVSQLGRSAD